MKIIFFGTPHFAAAHLEFLVSHEVEVAAVVTRVDRPKGRSGKPTPPPVKECAETLKLPILQPEKASSPDFIESLKKYQADLFVVVAYGKILREEVLEIPKLGCINVHASLLPKYRGAAPIQQVVIDGEKESGITIMHMAKEMDAGDVIHLLSCPIDPNCTFGELEKSLCELGCKGLLEVIHQFKEGRAKRFPQDHSKATYAGKIELEDCEINWNLPGKQIHDLIRGVNPYPGAWCKVSVRGQKKRLKIIQSTYLPDLQGKPAEVLIYGKDGFVIGTGEGAIKVHKLQLEGKRGMLSEEFVRGVSQDQIAF